MAISDRAFEYEQKKWETFTQCDITPLTLFNRRSTTHDSRFTFMSLSFPLISWNQTAGL